MSRFSRAPVFRSRIGRGWLSRIGDIALLRLAQGLLVRRAQMSRTTLLTAIGALAFLANAGVLPAQNQIQLGTAPVAPANASGPERVHKLATSGFTVDTSSREQVRTFYNAVFLSSESVAMNSTADVTNCVAGTNAAAFQGAMATRINWFRAMAGVPAAVSLDAAECGFDQDMALMMSANGALSHEPTPDWPCYSSDGANAASNSNLTLGSSGAQAITGYIWDFGTNNFEVGHRRWILYPQTQVMATGDVPGEGTHQPANATWVFDANIGGPRPATRDAFVAWPPPGYAPAPVVFPQWSFAWSNADFSVATVRMSSNGVTVPVAIQPYETGFGENTLVWVPSGLDYTTPTTFPFDGADTVYSVTITNIQAGGATFGCTYTVTVFDPSVPGADYLPTTVSGPAHPSVDAVNSYSSTPMNNPAVTGYEWRSSTCVSGNVSDGAENGPGNFTVDTTPGYSVITNGVSASGTNSFHLAQPQLSPMSNPADQVLQLNRLLFPATNSVLTFKSLLGYATTSQMAKVQVSTTDGTYWQDLYSLAGNGAQTETNFSAHTLSLSNFAGQPLLLRFSFVFTNNGDGYYSQTWTNPPVGWFLDNLVVTNSSQLVNTATNATATTNFNFVPSQTSNYVLQAGGVIFNQFPTSWGTAKLVTAVSNYVPPVIAMQAPVFSNGKVVLDFTQSAGSLATFRLLQAPAPGAVWTTNASAVLTTNVPGGLYRFTAVPGLSNAFYRIQVL